VRHTHNLSRGCVDQLPLGARRSSEPAPRGLGGTARARWTVRSDTGAR
jgi:hypothetical protein